MSVIYNQAAYDNAVKNYILANARKSFRVNVPRAGEIEAFLMDEVNKVNRFELWAKFYEALFIRYGKLTDKQVACVLNAIDKREAKKVEWAAKVAAENAKSGYVGKVGEKIKLTLKLVNIVEISVHRFSYYDSGVSYINIFKDDVGNVFIYRGKSNVGDKGDVVVLTASIKEQSEYKGCKQNVIQRPKVVEVFNEEKEVA